MPASVRVFQEWGTCVLGINAFTVRVFREWCPHVARICRATLLVEKLSNVPRIARWKELRKTDYPSFVYEVLDMDETSENEVST